MQPMLLVVRATAITAYVTDVAIGSVMVTLRVPLV